MARIVEDTDSGLLGETAPDDPIQTERWLRSRAADLVDWAGWQSIDAHERAAGEREGRPRVKLVRTPALFEIAAGRSVDATVR